VSTAPMLGREWLTRSKPLVPGYPRVVAREDGAETN